MSAELTLADLGAIGEFVGSIGVVATLVYLAIQVRQNSSVLEETHRALIAEGTREINLMSSQWHLEIAKSKELKSILLKAQRADMPEYSEEEWYEFRMVALSLMLQAQSLYAQKDLNLVYEDQIDNWLRSIKGVVVTYPAWAKYWRDAKEEGNLDAGFIEAVDGIEDGIVDMKKMLGGDI